uniref:AlNc14C569G12173 protein n=1 Tax=Albugo laibachii Nc14 TaxID=890382 RepID=F0X179_9STRA|nr:AlNc14C569G12173 [Albugo laibachii Nc14]|eukprot:CCA27537.1 AlNc14C569G12173 [Albugo laibachii Nc14]
MDGQEEFRGATPDYAWNAYREEYLDARGRGEPSLVKSLPGSDIAEGLARISTRLERTRLGSSGGFGIGGQTSVFLLSIVGYMARIPACGKSRCMRITSTSSQMNASTCKQYRDELRQEAAELHRGADELRAELHRQKEVNLRLQEQLYLRINDGPMGVHEVGDLDPHFVKVPTSTEGKISIEPFDGSEIYKGLGAGFVQWGQLLLVKIDFAERACGFRWP